MNEVKKGIRGRLTAATALTALLSGTAAVYHGLAPSGATLPYVVFTLISDEELNLTPRRERECVVDIKAISADEDMAGTIAARIEEAMETDINVTGYGVVWQRRDRAISLREVTDGKVYYHAGHTYRIRIQKLGG